MKNFKKVSLGLLSIATLASCSKSGPQNWDAYLEEVVKHSDQEIYDNALSKFKSAYAEAKQETSDTDKRIVLMAKAEAELLDSAVMLPTNSRGGYYAITHSAPHTVPYVFAGNDDYRLKSQVIADQLITSEDYAALKALWEEARSDSSKTYDPKTYLTGKGYTFNKKTLTTTWQTQVGTFDAQATSEAADSKVFINTYDGLVEYDNLGKLHGALAVDNFDGAGNPYKVSSDGKTYTFKIRSGVKWVNAQGQETEHSVTADDFVAGFQHLLDAQAGLESLVDGVIVGVHEYLNGGSFDGVGVKANGDELSFTLVNPETYFPSRLTYTMFAPLPRAYYESKGGRFGIQEYTDASTSSDYTYGKTINDVLSCGAFYFTQNTQSTNSGLISMSKNTHYYDADKVNFDTITFTYDNGENSSQMYNAVMNGTYVGINLLESNGTLSTAKNDTTHGKDGKNVFDTYHITTETDSTTYYGALNLKRQTFKLANNECTSPKSNDEAVAYFDAVQNINFRKAIMFAFDRTTFNAVTRGDDLKLTNMRNMYTAPEFTTISTQQTVDGITFNAGTTYGDICQAFVDRLGTGIKVADGQDGWNLPEKAKECLAKAKQELGDKWVGPVKIDVVAYASSTSILNQANAVKKTIEATLGADNVIVNVVNANTSDDYYACGYRAGVGKNINQDLFYDAGWGPDYLDPSSYLDTYLDDGAGYMTRLNGIW